MIGAGMAEVEAAEVEAYRGMKNRISKNTRASVVRQLLGIPKAESGYEHIGFNNEWSTIRADMRAIFGQYTDEQLDNDLILVQIARRFDTLESLTKHTTEPRRFVDWFRTDHMRGRVRTGKKKARQNSIHSMGSGTDVTADSRAETISRGTTVEMSDQDAPGEFLIEDEVEGMPEQDVLGGGLWEHNGVEVIDERGRKRRSEDQEDQPVRRVRSFYDPARNDTAGNSSGDPEV